MPEPTDAHRLEQVFQAAVEKTDPLERLAHVDRECGADEALRQAVLDLLKASEAAEQAPFWAHSAAANEARVEAAAERGTALGPYRVLRRIGSGGMGVVYRASRADGAFSKIVALKILGWSAGDPGSLRRFQQEREILARLEHPNIARLLDGGEAPDGRPFLVMEYVDGVPIDRYAEEHQLGLQERLTLFRQVCAAVTYAHRNLIVHRDLKPANILVSHDGSPKLLDFGIAKLQSDGQEITVAAGAALTPEYASPEQIRGIPVTTGSDVYSLAVTLYKLLTGRRPYGGVTGAPELARAVCEQEPSLAGTGLPKDVQNILQMALRKQPERRYASVEEFAEDIRRFQHAFPIRARADGVAYRAGRFVARHRLACAVGTLGVVSMISLGLAWVAQWRETGRRAEDVRTLSGTLIFDVYDSVRDLPGSMPARRQIADIAMRYLDRLASNGQPGDALRLDIAVASRKLGDILGEPYASSLGDTEGARQRYETAMRLFEGSRVHAPAERAAVYERLSRIYNRQGKSADARRLAAGAVAIRTRLRAAAPGDAIAAMELVQSYLHLGEAIYADAERRSDGSALPSILNLYEDAARVGRPVIEGADALPPDVRARVWDTWGIYQRHTAYVHWLDGRLSSNREAYRLATTFSKAGYTAAEHADRATPGRFSLLWTLTGAYGDHGHALMLAGDARAGIAWHDRSLEGLLRLGQIDPDNRELQREIADTAMRLGQCRETLEPDRAIADYRKALAMYSAFLEANPNNQENVGLAVETRIGLAVLLLRKGDRKGAARLHQESLSLLERSKHPGDLVPKVRALLAEASAVD
ncbi:MAG: serine/threonine protein kinase [Bryobacterales bacterium]|nr:serine/threonine protein kinase [Bryobacterales bacterium]